MKKELLPLMFLIMILCSCRHQAELDSSVDQDNVDNNLNYNTSNYHTDTNYKYEYRTGDSGSYEYNYDVSGTDEYGNDVSGNVNMEGKNGTGVIQDSEGNEIEVDLEWVDYGIINATDYQGNSYELGAD